MNNSEKLAIAALLHDLPILFDQSETAVPTDARKILDLAVLDDPALSTLLKQAERYAVPGKNLDQLIVDKPVVSVFSRVELNHSAQIHYHNIAPLPATNAPNEQFARLFPVSEENGSGLKRQIQDLLEELAWLGQSVDLDSFDNFYQHLLTVLHRYGWCLPAHGQDVSLFDHARLTSAIAVALYHYHEQQSEFSIERVEESLVDECFCLLVGDLSGIQKYIFDITTIGAGGGVARRLRARSFYLSIMADVLSHRIAAWFDMPLGNVIMASGGKFYVLAPNSADVEARVSELRHEIDQWFHDEFNGEITINLAHICFQGDRFRAGKQQQQGFGSLLAELGGRLNREKRRSGQTVLSNGTSWDDSAFMIERDFWGAGVCASCRKFPANSERENLCDQCIRDAELGRRLPRARYVAYYIGETGNLPMPLNCTARVLNSSKEVEQVGQPYLLTKLNDPEIHELASASSRLNFRVITTEKTRIFSLDVALVTLVRFVIWLIIFQQMTLVCR